jgi:protein-disulfide isomerase
MEGEKTPQIHTSTAQAYAIPVAIVIAGLAIAAAVYFGGNKPAAAGQQVATIAPVTAKDHIIGNPNAKIVIIEYADTECPLCKVFHSTLQRIMSDYGKDGQVAWVYRHFPLSMHSKAQKEAEATECASKLGGESKFWEFTNKVFEVTKGNNSLDEAELPKIAAAIGLDVAAFNKCVASGEMKSIIDKDISSGTKAGVQGTPNSYILVNKTNAAYLNGAYPYEDVKAGIDELLKK